MDGPSQYFPPLEGRGLVQERNLNCIPPPHVAEQRNQRLQGDQPPFTREQLETKLRVISEKLELDSLHWHNGYRSFKKIPYNKKNNNNLCRNTSLVHAGLVVCNQCVNVRFSRNEISQNFLHFLSQISPFECFRNSFNRYLRRFKVSNVSLLGCLINFLEASRTGILVSVGIRRIGQTK